MSTVIDQRGGEAPMSDSETAELTILYGSQTGNAEYLAHQIHGSAQKGGREMGLASLEDWLHSNELRLRRLLVVTATHDNGHMPDNAAEFWDWLNSLPAGALDGLPFAVLSIGDSMYEDFCKAGHDIDRRLEELGAVRVVEGIDCDIDFEFTATKWSGPAVEELLAADAWAALAPGAAAATPPAVAGDTASNADSVHEARVVASEVLSKVGSAKNVTHYELALSDAFEYAPGDSLSVFIENSPNLVDEWLSVFGNPTLTYGGTPRALDDVLRTEVELRLPHPGLIVGLSRLQPDSDVISDLIELIQSGDRVALDGWLWARDVLDVIIDLGGRNLPIEGILGELRPLQHRDYSIASSPLRDDGHVHLTVGGVFYDGARGRQFGAATAFLRARAADGRPFRVRRAPAHEFRLPADDVPMIMIGPGVGVAPFRAFLRHRDAVGATGRNWLFFGDQHRSLDFLYEDEFDELRDRGVLARIDAAFSRDQAEKNYVQHEMMASAEQIREWIGAGAYVFVCGDKARMAPDVDEALIQILGGDGTGHTALTALREAARYVKDVY